MDLQCDTKFLLYTFPRVVSVLIWNFLRLLAAGYTGLLHCKPIPVMRTRFSLQGNSVFITGNPVLIAWIPVIKTGFSLWEFPHRENPVFITGIGLQCAGGMQLCRVRLSCLNAFLQIITFHFPCMKAILYFCRHALLGDG